MTPPADESSVELGSDCRSTANDTETLSAGLRTEPVPLPLSSDNDFVIWEDPAETCQPPACAQHCPLQEITYLPHALQPLHDAYAKHAPCSNVDADLSA